MLRRAYCTVSVILAAIELLLADKDITREQKSMAENAMVAGQYLLSLIAEVSRAEQASND